MRSAKAGGGRMAKIPVVTYLIDSMQMFQFQGVPMLLVVFENHSVRMFESDNGHYCHEFIFYDTSESYKINEEQLAKVKE